MKVTAILPDDLINKVKHYSKGKNITESLIIALMDWMALQKIKELNKKNQKRTPEVQKRFFCW